MMSKMSDVAQIIMGQSPSSSYYNENGIGLPFYQGKSDFGLLHPTPKKYCTNPKKIAIQNDILISVRAPVGPTNICNETSCIGRGLAAIRAKKIDFKFLFYNLKYVETYISSLGSGSTFKAINKNQLSNISINENNFDLQTQKKIAYILSTVQRAIEEQERLIQVTTKLKKALMNKLFTEGTRGEPQKETEIGLVPESWNVQKLGNIAECISKGSSPRWQGFEYVSEGVLFVRSQNVGEGRMNFYEKAFVPGKFNLKEKRSILKSGDILINLVGASIGRVALGSHEIEGANCNQAVCFVRANIDISLKYLIVYYLLSPTGQNQMHFQKKDIARANLSLLDVKGFLIPIPQKDEQEVISNLFINIDKKIGLFESRKEYYSNLFRTLLHQLMTAQLRVHEIDFELLTSIERDLENAGS